jgi:hypothetical protein
MKRKQHRVPLWITAVVTLLVVALNIYWWWTYTGPFRWFAELQILNSNRYDNGSTLLVTLAASAGAMMVVTLILNSFGAFDRLATDADRADVSRPWMDWCFNHLGALMGVAVGICVFVTGVTQFVQGRTAGALKQIDVALLEAGKTPPSRWVKIHGQFLPGESVKEMSGAKEQSHYHYYPVVSANWKAGDPVAVVVKAPSFLVERPIDIEKILRDSRRRMDRMELESRGLAPPDDELQAEEVAERDAELARLKKGMLSRRGLPGIVITGLERSGYRLADSCYMLDCLGSPESEITFGKILMAIGIALIVISTIGSFVWTWWEESKTSAEPMPTSMEEGTDQFATEQFIAPHVPLGADGKDGIMYRN